jgi:hypothetical protein
MEFRADNVDEAAHRTLAKALFNFTWELIEKPDRSPDETDLMINAAHAGRFHWGLVGTPRNAALSEWQIARVYALAGRGEAALVHARKSLELTVQHQLGDFELGFAHEAMARAYGVQARRGEQDVHLNQARACAARVAAEDDRTWLLRNVETVPSLTLPVWGSP